MQERVFAIQCHNFMDAALFQFYAVGLANESDASGILRARPVAPALREDMRPSRVRIGTTNSANLDLLRSFAVLLVVGFHLAKFFNWQPDTLRVTDFGLLGVMFFFVHTTLVLMFFLQRQRTEYRASLLVPFMMRRCFRIYPLAMVVVILAYLLRIPSDLQFGGFHLLRQSRGNLLANLLLVQNVARQKANPGILWSLPLELQMYLVLPALFLFAARVKSSWKMIGFWWLVVGLWFATGYSTGTLLLSEGGIRSPVEALLKFTRFAPCFLAGIVVYKLWSRPRLLPSAGWPLFLALCCAAFLWRSGSQPIETGWFICFAIGLGVCVFHEMPANLLARLASRIARYSYGIYLLHYFAIWIAFVVFRKLNVTLQASIFVFVLLSLSVLLYHTVEAPLIGVGVRLSKRLQHGWFQIAFKGRSTECAAQILSE
jgi:peptidoglycan/LPS O-acetylase OafA/YrhL